MHEQALIKHGRVQTDKGMGDFPVFREIKA